MGKLYEIGNVLIRIYGNDHLPAHFHIIAPDFQALVEIETLTVLRGSVEGKSGKAALAWAAKNIATLKEEWNRTNPRFPV